MNRRSDAADNLPEPVFVPVLAKYFLGESTPNGFSTPFAQQISAEGYFTCILKGGPGTGKSGLMRKIAEEFQKQEDIDVYYCASDPDSLDAVVLHQSKFIIVDGTSPQESVPVSNWFTFILPHFFRGCKKIPGIKIYEPSALRAIVSLYGFRLYEKRRYPHRQKAKKSYLPVNAYRMSRTGPAGYLHPRYQQGKQLFTLRRRKSRYRVPARF